ncbi:hypothetical protein Tco_0468364 [Tanacetum coccineum]
MAGLLFNKFKEDRGEGHMAWQCTKTKRTRNSAWFKEKMLLDTEIISDSNIISYEQYLQQMQNASVQDTNSSVQQDSLIISMFEQMSEKMSNQITHWEKSRKMIDLQMNDMIRDRCALKQVMEKESLLKTLTVFKKESKEKEDKYMDKEIDLEKKIKELDNIVYKVDFDNALHSERNEVKTVFNQMEADVNQCSVDKKYFDILKKEVFLDNDQLLDHIICQDVMNIVMHADSILANVLPADNKCLVNDNLKIKRLEQENDHLFKHLLSQDIVHVCVNSYALRNDCREMQQDFIDEYNENLMLKLDLAPLAPKLLNNRDAPIDYIKLSREHDETLWEIVEHARALRPLDSDLDYACKIVQQIQEVLVYVRDSSPSLTKR